MIFREPSKGIVKCININKFSVEESTVYQYITLSVSSNYTVTAHDIVDCTIVTNPSAVYPQVMEYIILPSPTKTVITTSNCTVLMIVLFVKNYQVYQQQWKLILQQKESTQIDITMNMNVILTLSRSTRACTIFTFRTFAKSFIENFERD